MSKMTAKVLDIDGKFRENPDSPIAVVREPYESEDGKTGEGLIVDPVFNHSVTGNLYGRILTLVEATTEQHKLKSVKDLFSRELRDWESDVYEGARQIAEGVGSTSNIYTR